jgi:hypothetical protein
VQLVVELMVAKKLAKKQIGLRIEEERNSNSASFGGWSDTEIFKHVTGYGSSKILKASWNENAIRISKKSWVHPPTLMSFFILKKTLFLVTSEISHTSTPAPIKINFTSW